MRVARTRLGCRRRWAFLAAFDGDGVAKGRLPKTGGEVPDCECASPLDGVKGACYDRGMTTTQNNPIANLRRAALVALERAEHPDVMDRFGRVWTWWKGDLYRHCGNAAPKHMIDGFGLPSQTALDNPNYDLCGICLDGRDRHVTACKREWECSHATCARIHVAEDAEEQDSSTHCEPATLPSTRATGLKNADALIDLAARAGLKVTVRETEESGNDLVAGHTSVAVTIEMHSPTAYAGTMLGLDIRAESLIAFFYRSHRKGARAKFTGAERRNLYRSKRVATLTRLTWEVEFMGEDMRRHFERAGELLPERD